MEYPSELSVGSAPSLGVLDRGLGLLEHWRRVSIAQESLRQMGMPRVNMLFIGADDVVWRVLGTSLNLAAPVVSWRPGQPLHVPDLASIRSLVVREVGEMTGAEQVRLLQWLDRAAGHTQVICTSTEPLMPLVDDGTFVNALYYRLNTICVDLRR